MGEKLIKSLFMYYIESIETRMWAIVERIREKKSVDSPFKEVKVNCCHPSKIQVAEHRYCIYQSSLKLVMMCWDLVYTYIHKRIIVITKANVEEFRSWYTLACPYSLFRMKLLFNDWKKSYGLLAIFSSWFVAPLLSKLSISHYSWARSLASKRRANWREFVLKDVA